MCPFEEPSITGIYSNEHMDHYINLGGIVSDGQKDGPPLTYVQDNGDCYTPTELLTEMNTWMINYVKNCLFYDTFISVCFLAHKIHKGHNQFSYLKET